MGDQSPGHGLCFTPHTSHQATMRQTDKYQEPKKAGRTTRLKLKSDRDHALNSIVDGVMLIGEVDSIGTIPGVTLSHERNSNGAAESANHVTEELATATSLKLLARCKRATHTYAMLLLLLPGYASRVRTVSPFGKTTRRPITRCCLETKSHWVWVKLEKG